MFKIGLLPIIGLHVQKEIFLVVVLDYYIGSLKGNSKPLYLVIVVLASKMHYIASEEHCYHQN